jgi:hypothetical protein
MALRAAELVAGIIAGIESRRCRPGRPPLPTIKVIATLRFFVRAGVPWRERRPGALAAPPGLAAWTAGAARRSCAGSTPP